MYLKVRLDPTPKKGDKNRDYFTVMEGAEKGQKASVSKIRTKKCNGYWPVTWGCQVRHDSRLFKNVPMKGPCFVQYQKVKATSKGYKEITEHTKLSVGSLINGKFKPVIKDVEVIHQFDLIKPGRYKLKIAGAEHVTKGQKYLSQSISMRTNLIIARNGNASRT